MKVDLQATSGEWDRFVIAHPNGHVLQTSAWGELKSAYGWRAERLVVRTGQRLLAGAQVLYRPLVLGTQIAYVPKGPVVDFKDRDACQCLFAALHRRCRSQRAILLKVEPDLYMGSERDGVEGGGPPPWVSLPYSAGPGFRPATQTIQPRRTILLDLTVSEERLLQRMKSKTRYNIRLAARKGIEVREGGSDDIHAFTRLMVITGERDDFGVHTPDYYERAHALLAPAGMACLFMATYQGQPIAGVMVFACGHKAWYMYGASGHEHRERMPNYALQWAAIRWARARGCRTYDLYGIPDEDKETLEAQFTERSDGLWGVYRFKRGFGGQIRRSVGAYDAVYNRPLYWLYHQALRLRG
jgi:lipid II:glycine glycyltransferase (peptidoglycan interpeptide bridge formation enzyme)